MLFGAAVYSRDDFSYVVECAKVENDDSTILTHVRACIEMLHTRTNVLQYTDVE